MTTWLDRLLTIALVIVVGSAAATALPAVTDGDVLRGRLLRAHMVAGGALVIGLPIVALWFLRRAVGGGAFHALGCFGYWTVMASGWVTIASVYVCMVPVASTDQMHELVELHGAAGWAMSVAVLALLAGAFQESRPRRQSPPR